METTNSRSNIINASKDLATWNRPRTTEFLQEFVRVHLEALDD